MTRYITKQRHKFSCSAIALINILKWRGFKLTSKHLTSLQIFGLWSRYDGSDIETLIGVLELHGVGCEKIDNTLVDVEESLESGKILMIVVENKLEESHVFLALPSTESYVKLLNHPTNWLTEKLGCDKVVFEGYLKYCKVWEVV